MITMQVTEADRLSLERDLAIALSDMSSGKLNSNQAAELARVAVKNLDFSNSALAHKGVNWYARKLLSIVDIEEFSSRMKS